MLLLLILLIAFLIFFVGLPCLPGLPSQIILGVPRILQSLSVTSRWLSLLPAERYLMPYPTSSPGWLSWAGGLIRVVTFNFHALRSVPASGDRQAVIDHRRAVAQCASIYLFHRLSCFRLKFLDLTFLRCWWSLCISHLCVRRWISFNLLLTLLLLLPVSSCPLHLLLRSYLQWGSRHGLLSQVSVKLVNF